MRLLGVEISEGFRLCLILKKGEGRDGRKETLVSEREAASTQGVPGEWCDGVGGVSSPGIDVVYRVVP